MSKPPALIALLTLRPVVVFVVVFIVVLSDFAAFFFRERLTELQRPCHDDGEKIETVFQRSGFADVPREPIANMTSER